MGYVKRKSLWRAWRGLRRCPPALLLVLVTLLLAPSSAAAGFGVESFTVTARNADGTIDEVAASHPYALDVSLSMNADRLGKPEGALSTIQIDLPPDLIGNSLAVPRCSLADFGGSAPRCAGSTQIGILRARVGSLGQLSIPIFNLVASPGYAAVFGVSVEKTTIFQRLKLMGSGATSSVRLSVVLPPEQEISDIEEEIWGVPAASSHDPERTCWTAAESVVEGCSAGGAAEKPLLTLSASCAEPLRTTVTAVSLGPPSLSAVASAFSRDAAGNPRPLVGCDAIPFEPRLSVAGEAVALAPTALTVGLEMPQHESVGASSAASLAALHLELPDGVALNPAVGSWLTGCSPGEIGLESAPGVVPPVLGVGASSCPPSSQMGSVKLKTPLVDHALVGAIYLATPSANPFGARYAFYLVIEDEATGTIIKAPGRLEADAGDGRLSATVAEFPQFPFSDLQLEFGGGPRAPLVSPPSCGRYTAAATFSPSTVPFELPAARSAGFMISAGAGGAPCPPPEAARPATPSFQAGTKVPRAGGDSSLLIRLSRQDTDQHLGSFELNLPPGLVANLGSVPIGAAVGGVRVAAGVGPDPLRLDGTVYLEGPYRGAPYSLAIVVPARAGPFDFGTIVQRAAISVDPVTAQIGVHSDPLPRILAGVPLELRGLTLDLNRSGFIRNPTTCEPMAITGSATTSLGQAAPLSARFQVGDCAGLGFRPKLALRLLGPTGKGAHPRVRAVLSTRRGDANISRAAITLPGSELLDNRRLGDVCTGAQYRAGTCPARSVYGHAKVSTPLLGAPLEGPVYLRESRGRLPQLAVSLAGGIHLDLVAHIDSVHGRLRARFGSLPDVPLDKLVLTLRGGRKGLLVNTGGVCRGGLRAGAWFAGHNGKARSLSPIVRTDCGNSHPPDRPQRLPLLEQ